MGYRTVVVLYNDQCGEWENDPELGKKIYAGMNFCEDRLCLPNQFSDPTNLHYGKVVQCTHADTQSLVVIDGYSMKSIMHSFRHMGREDETLKHIRLLREAADGLGYKLIKKSDPKSID
jgi:hypothetical protein